MSLIPTSNRPFVQCTMYARAVDECRKTHQGSGFLSSMPFCCHDWDIAVSDATCIFIFKFGWEGETL